MFSPPDKAGRQGAGTHGMSFPEALYLIFGGQATKDNTI